MFAKLYETEEVGQILVKLDEGAGPEVRFYFKPEGLGVCSLATSFSDDEEGWDKAEHYFTEVNEEMAINGVKATLENLFN